MLDRLLDSHPNNVVRLTLPRMVDEPIGPGDPYLRAASRLRRWRARGVLVSDPRPALYVYEYGDPAHTVTGLIGAVGLQPPDRTAVLPHEDVIPNIVADRLAMMEAADANLEPILLVYDGAGENHGLLHDVTSGDPVTDIRTDDGSVHRLWAVTDAGCLAEVRRRLAPHQALIADGHHRYASYRQLRRRHRARGAGAGAWDGGLALLVDQSEYPLRLEAIHRSLAEVRLDDLVAPPGTELSAPTTAAGGGPSLPTAQGELLLTDGRACRWLRVSARPNAVTDAELLHEVLLPSWSVSEDRVGYHHTVAQALREAEQDGGVAVLLHAADVAAVMAVARAGKVLPRKSTSFGPKPRTGLVLRDFADEAG